MSSFARFLTYLLVVLQLSCSTRPFANRNKPSGSPRYRLEIGDTPDRRRFLLTLTSLDDRPLCLEITQWPNALGQVDSGSMRTILDSAEGKYPARDENFGYCVGEECIIHLAPRASLKGFIGYAEFGKPEAIAALSQRRLRYTISPSVCQAKVR